MVMGRNGYGSKWPWAEMVMGRNDPDSSGIHLSQWQGGRRSGLVVERRTPEREVGVGSSLRLPCCILEQDTFTSEKKTGNNQEAVAPFRHD